ncbi:MAG: NAD(+) diphosphatase [Pseudomonadota bacterium]
MIKFEPQLIGFVGNPLDRRDDIRGNRDEVDKLRSRPDAKTWPFHKLRPLIKLGADLEIAWYPAAGDLTNNLETIFLGEDHNKVPCFAASIDDADVAAALKSEDQKFLDARSAGAQLGDGRAGILAQARSLLSWHHTHRACSQCGAETDLAKAGYARHCPNCGAQHFPRTDPVVIMLPLFDDHALLGRQPGFPPGFYSALAGFVEPGETIEEAVERETWEEAGIRVSDVRYVASQPWPFPSSLMIGCVAKAHTKDLVLDTTEIEDAIWVSRAEMEAAFAGKNGSLMVPPNLAIAHHLLTWWLANPSRS